MARAPGGANNMRPLSWGVQTEKIQIPIIDKRRVKKFNQKTIQLYIIHIPLAANFPIFISAQPFLLAGLSKRKMQ